LHRAARISAAGHVGQILLSQTTRDEVAGELPPEAELRDLGAHRLKDLPHPEHLFQLSLAGLPTEFPPLKSLDAHPNNLPLALTRFIGREQEKAELRQCLVGQAVSLPGDSARQAVSLPGGSARQADSLPHTRLLTLTGAGGCGKTRLALELAADLLEGLPD